MKKRKPIVSPYGNIGVDSGQLLIIDPCYLEMFMKKYSYEDICEHPQGNMVYPKGHEGIACKLESFGGDVPRCIFPFTLWRNLKNTLHHILNL